MQVLPKGRNFPDPGPLGVGVMRGAGARAEILEALGRVIGETLRVQELTRRAA
jgi:hypothetical protein